MTLSEFLLDETVQQRLLKLTKFVLTIVGGYLALLPALVQIGANRSSILKVGFQIQDVWLKSLPEYRAAKGLGRFDGGWAVNGVVLLRYFGPLPLGFMILKYIGFFSGRLTLTPPLLLGVLASVTVPLTFFLNSAPAWVMMLHEKIEKDPTKRLAILGSFIVIAIALIELFT